MKEGVVKESSIRSKEVQAAAIYHKGARTILSSVIIKAQIEKKPRAFKASEEEMLTIKRSL